MKLPLRGIALSALLLAAALQVVPYGHTHRNPAVRQEPAWDSPRTRALVVHACFDCHSNETRWPWYSRVAPVSWLIQRDVEAGRRHLNFSEFDHAQRHAAQAAREVAKGDMPMAIYLLAHPAARLSGTEKAELIAGLTRTLGEPKPRQAVATASQGGGACASKRDPLE
jgi:hypothetical protein